MNDVVIIGGGVAGLSAGIHAAQQGLKPILIEGGGYPAHKVCGEFFSPEALPLLAQWGITPPVKITRAHFLVGSQKLSLQLPSPAGSMSRFYFDNLLMHTAVSHGVDVRTNTMVQGIQQDNGIYNVQVSSGEILSTKSLVIGTGRVTNLLLPNSPATSQTQEPSFIGMKAHFANPGINPQDVFFFTFPGAYLGISVVENNVINIACLARKKHVDAYRSPEEYIQHLAAQPHAKLLQNILQAGSLFPDWLKAPVFGFGMHATPDLKNVYYIGDGAGAIPPATGDGLAIALTTGALLAPYLARQDSAGFKTAWQKRYHPLFRNGILLHTIMFSPMLSKMTVALGNFFPRATRMIFEKTRMQ